MKLSIYINSILLLFSYLEYSIAFNKSCTRDHSGDQLCHFEQSHREKVRATNLLGCPLASLTASLSIGSRGPLLLQDTNLITHLAKFDRERIPERVVHAKGAGAYGYFEVTHNITQYTKASVFSHVGKKTQVFVRFSTVGGESGSADTVRDPRGFAIKFYAGDGNWDLVGLNLPTFFVRDPILFPSFVHSQKRNPQTYMKDRDMFWDFITLRPETVHQTAFLFSDRGIPDGYRHMHGYSAHTYKFVNSHGTPVYVKFHMRTNQGIKNIQPENAMYIAGTNPDYAIKDLYNAIEEKRFPSWDMFIQIMTFDQAKTYKYNPFDVTKVWLHADFPLVPVGKLVLNLNPTNYFNEVEQAAFAPGNFIQGIEASPDKMLQGRIFSYPDTQRHRLGPNFELIPVNFPRLDAQIHHYERDGLMNIQTNSGLNGPNYFPNSFNGPFVDPLVEDSKEFIVGQKERKDSGDEDNFSQANLFWTRVLKEDEKERLVNNMASHVKGSLKEFQNRLMEIFSKVNVEWGERLKKAIALNHPFSLNY